MRCWCKRNAPQASGALAPAGEPLCWRACPKAKVGRAAATAVEQESRKHSGKNHPERSSGDPGEEGEEKRPSHAPLTLRQGLEQVAQLGADYVLTDQETVWTAQALLAWLAASTPDHLGWPVALRLPDAHQEGAICHLTPHGGFLVLYHILPRKPL